MDNRLVTERIHYTFVEMKFEQAANVPGRIRLLIVSMITINGINIVGVPWGTKCSNMWLVFLIHPNNINLIHKGRAKVNVSVWE